MLLFPNNATAVNSVTMVFAIPRSLPHHFAAVLLSLVLIVTTLPSQALAQGDVAVIRDAEIEALVADYATPILKAAGLTKSGVEIILVNDNSFNAFVVGRRIFINTGALMIAETPNEIIGVLAHEAGHIAGGHQQRLQQQLARAKNLAVLTAVLGIGAAVAGASTGEASLAQAGQGIAFGGSEAARRSLLAYQRNEEITADRAAVKYLDQTKQSSSGMLRTFQRFQNALSLSGARIDPYQVSHPLPRDRIQNLSTLAQASPYFNTLDSAGLQARHDMARTKIAAYTGGAGGLARLSGSARSGIGAEYGAAISAHLYGSQADALKRINALIAKQPSNPWFQEMKGEILVKANKPGDAAAAYARAVKATNSALIQVQLGRAYTLAGGEKNLKLAIRNLSAATAREKNNPQAYFYLAQAYGQNGDTASAELASAEASYYSGDIRQAKIFAARAQTRFKRGSPEWVRAQDILEQKG
jgi:predicted Zn-dependent protease